MTSSEPDSGLHEGLMLVSHGNRGLARMPDGNEVEALYRRGVGRPVCGDRVRLDQFDGRTAAVCAIENRKNIFARADSRQRKQIVAANLDQVLIVLAIEPAPSRDLLERYLVAAHSLEIKPIIVINKTDLLKTTDNNVTGPFTRLEQYQDLGYVVVETSCKGAPGVDALNSYLAGKISILVGQSGVGKSSLINRLVPDLDLQTSALSRSTGKGRHTTTSTMMYQLRQNPPDKKAPPAVVDDGGGYLVDSPGVWEYGLWHLNEQELERGFAEFRPYLGKCKFNNCAHNSEPDCAVKSAVENGFIAQWRYDSYTRLLREQ